MKRMWNFGMVSLLAVMTIALVTGCGKSEQASVGGKSVSSPNIGTLRFVPAGSFQRDEKADNITTVGGFYIGEKEITWEQFVKVTNLSKPAFSDVAQFAKETSAPVTTLTWYHCLVFCNKLSMMEGLTPVYTISGSSDPTAWGTIPENVDATWDAVTEDSKANGYRLPTEAEWEWAAMGAVEGTTGFQKTFAGSTKLNNGNDFAWIVTNSDSILHKVGSKQPNELGLYDMSGNAAEWCWDWKAEYPAGALDNASFRGAPSGGEYGQRVVRGGSFASQAYDVTVAIRGGQSPNYHGVSSGFRVVRY